MAAKRSDGKVGVLFVCLGNICRSPTAEAVFVDVVKKANKSNEYVVDSCGTGGGSSDWYKAGGFSYHEGDNADPRMTGAAAQRGVKLTSKSRPLRPTDFAEFQYIVGMDAANMKAIKTAADYWKGNGASIPEDYPAQLHTMASFCRSQKVDAVPDPYYGGSQGFEKVLDLLDDACTNFLAQTEADRC